MCDWISDYAHVHTEQYPGDFGPEIGAGGNERAGRDWGRRSCPQARERSRPGKTVYRAVGFLSLTLPRIPVTITGSTRYLSTRYLRTEWSRKKTNPRQFKEMKLKEIAGHLGARLEPPGAPVEITVVTAIETAAPGQSASIAYHTHSH